MVALTSGDSSMHAVSAVTTSADDQNVPSGNLGEAVFGESG